MSLYISQMSCILEHMLTARSMEDETRNANRNPEWWEDFSQLQIQIKPKSGFEFVPRNTEEFKFDQRMKIESIITHKEIM